MQGRGYSDRSLILAGSNTLEGMHVISVGWDDNYYRPIKVNREDVDANSLKNCTRIVKGFDTIYADEKGQKYLRLRKGVNTFLMGIKERQAHFRLHNFVRAIEAIIKPATAKTTNQFIHRCQFFAGRSDNVREILRDLYEMRSASEHLNPLKDKLARYPPHEHENIIALRTYQAELLARHVYCRILSDIDLLNMFIDDDSIAQFWKKPDHEQIACWGPQIDLEAQSEERFLDYL